MYLPELQEILYVMMNNEKKIIEEELEEDSWTVYFHNLFVFWCSPSWRVVILEHFDFERVMSEVITRVKYEFVVQRD